MNAGPRLLAGFSGPLMTAVGRDAHCIVVARPDQSQHTSRPREWGSECFQSLHSASNRFMLSWMDYTARLRKNPSLTGLISGCEDVKDEVRIALSINTAPRSSTRGRSFSQSPSPRPLAKYLFPS